MFESKSGVLLVAGLGFFAFAFLSNALVPALMYRNLPEATTAELVEKNSNVMYQFENLSFRYPEQFAKYFGEATQEQLRRGPGPGAAGVHERRLLALPQPIRAAGLARGGSLGTGLEDRGVSEYFATAGHVRHAARRSRLVAGGRPPGE